jgi:transcriptional regulator GlxA family with amidase domain
LIWSFAGMSATRFKLGFKDLYNYSVYAYQLNKRLEKAYALVEQTNDPIKKIARDTGFKQITHFRKAFKQKYSVPPGALRNKPDRI